MTINFGIFTDFTPALKIYSLLYVYSTCMYNDSLVDPQSFSPRNFQLYGCITMLYILTLYAMVFLTLKRVYTHDLQLL